MANLFVKSTYVLRVLKDDLQKIRAYYSLHTDMHIEKEKRNCQIYGLNLI